MLKSADESLKIKTKLSHFGKVQIKRKGSVYMHWNWFVVEFLCNGEKDSTTIYAESRAKAAKETCQYIKSKGDTYIFIKAKQLTHWQNK